MSGIHFNRDLGVELLGIHNYHDDFPNLPLFDIPGTFFIEFLQKTSDDYTYIFINLITRNFLKF
jgi:hypothetical protein